MESSTIERVRSTRVLLRLWDGKHLTPTCECLNSFLFLAKRHWGLWHFKWRML